MKIAIIVPIYTKELSPEEIYSVERWVPYAQKFDIYFIMPYKLNSEFYEKKFSQFKIKRYSNFFFDGIPGYNRLMLSEEFYKSFSEYEYILISQTDAYLLRNPEKLFDFAELGYSYYGAVWNPPVIMTRDRINYFVREKALFVGNGGFSLRKTETTLRLLYEKRRTVKYWSYNEDIFFSRYGRKNKCDYRIAPVEIAMKFAADDYIEIILKNGDELPLAFHAWKKKFGDYDNMKKFILNINDVRN